MFCLNYLGYAASFCPSDWCCQTCSVLIWFLECFYDILMELIIWNLFCPISMMEPFAMMVDKLFCLESPPALIFHPLPILAHCCSNPWWKVPFRWSHRAILFYFLQDFSVEIVDNQARAEFGLIFHYPLLWFGQPTRMLSLGQHSFWRYFFLLEFAPYFQCSDLSALQPFP